MRILDRLQDGLGDLLDEITLSERLRSRLDEGGRLLANGHAAAALDVARAVEAERPGLWRTALVEGLALEMLGRLDEAVGALERALSVRDAAIVRNALGRICQRLDQTSRARTHFEAALERHPTDAERLGALLGIAAVHEHDGPPWRAVAPLRAALKLAPDDEQIVLRLGRSLLAADDAESAVALVAPRAASASVELLRVLARAHQRRDEDGDRAAAESVYRAILDRTPEDFDAIEQIGNLHVRRNDLSGALTCFQRALAVAPVLAHARLLAAVARCHTMRNERLEALDALRAAAGLAPDDLSALPDYAILAVGHGPVDEALEATDRWLVADPGSRSARAARGRALLRAGRIGDAREVIAPLRASVMAADELESLARLALAEGDASEALALVGELIALAPEQRPIAVGLRDEAWSALTPTIERPGPREQWTAASVERLIDAVVAAVSRHPRFAAQGARIEAIARRLEAPLSVAVLGEFNAGKSTLLNAWLGESVLPVGVLPTTSRVNVVRYGPRPVASIAWNDGIREEVAASRARERIRERDAEVDRLDFEWPHPDLRAVHLWDTPGFNAPDPRHEAEALRALAEADAIVWLVDVNQALSATELERVRRIGDAREKLVVAINKIDRVGDDTAALDEVGAHVERALGGAYATMVFLSARRALEARLNDDAAGLEASRWPAFETALREHLLDRAGRIKALDAGAALAGEIAGLRDRGRLLAEGASVQRTRLEELRSRIESWGARFESLVVQPALQRLTHALQAARAEAASELTELGAGSAGLLSRARLSSEDRETILNHLREAADRAHAESVGEVERAVSDLRAGVLRETERVCAELGGAEARVMRRRIELFVATDAALRRSLADRVQAAPRDVVSALVQVHGAAVLDAALGELARGGVTEAAFVTLIAVPSTDWTEQLVRWGTSWSDSVLTLIDRLQRDLEQVALDVERRIIQPLHAVLEALEPRIDAETGALDSADGQA